MPDPAEVAQQLTDHEAARHKAELIGTFWRALADEQVPADVAFELVAYQFYPPASRLDDGD